MNDPQNFLENQWRASEADITGAQRLLQWITQLGEAMDGWRQEQVADLDPQDYDPEDYYEPDPYETEETHMRWDVYVQSSIIYSAASYEEARIVADRILDGNRLAVTHGRDAVYIYETQGEPSPVSIDDLELPWLASLTRTHAGWDVFPKPYGSRLAEGVYSYEKDYNGVWSRKQVYVIAASALEAIERAKFLLCVGGHKNA